MSRFLSMLAKVLESISCQESQCSLQSPFPLYADQRRIRDCLDWQSTDS
jgi:hypothetical protein